MKRLALFIALILLPAQTWAAYCDTNCITINLKHSRVEYIPDFCQATTKTSAGTGNWNTAGTWTPSGVPGASDVVKIVSAHTVTMNASAGVAKNICVETGGTLTWTTNANTQLTFDTILVKTGGTMNVGTTGTPIGSSNTATLIVRNTAPDTVDDASGVYDPEQFGTGILATGGTVRMVGATKTSFVRFGAETTVSATTVTFGSAVSGWGAGDTVVIPDTQAHTTDKWIPPHGPISPQWEERTISSVAGDNLSIVVAGLTYAHKGARNNAGTIQKLPHIGNITRNVVVKSENPAATRGHVLFIGRADVDVRYVEFQDLGRTTTSPLDSTTIASGAITKIGTNQVGRYPLHMHHLMGPSSPQSNGWQFTLIGNAVNNAASGFHFHKWGIAVHNAHWGLVQSNITYNTPGAAFMLEDGSERGNLVELNFALRTDGDGTREDGRCDPDCGHDGSAFWMRGPLSRIKNNVAANASKVGILWMSNLLKSGPGLPNGFGDVLVPTAQGNDSATTSSIINIHQVDFAEGGVSGDGAKGNEAYSSRTCFTMWSIGVQGEKGIQIPEPNRITADGQICWHNATQLMYPTHNLTMKNFEIWGDKTAYAGTMQGSGIDFGDYRGSQVILDNFKVEGYAKGITMPCGQTRGNSQPAYVQTIKNSTFNNCINIRVRDPFHNGHVTDYRGFRTEVRDTVVNRPTGINCGIAYDVYMNKVPGSLVAELVVENSLYWFNWGADPDIDLRIYFKEQRDTAILDQSTFYPSGVPQKIACPSAGLTNTQCNTTHGVRFAGEIATCTDDTTRPTVFGFTCLLTGAGAPDPPPEDPPPPANQNPPTGLSIGASP